MKRSNPLRHVLAMLLLAGTTVADDALATSYRIVELPLPAQLANGSAGSINAAGDVVGYATDRDFQVSVAAIWKAPDYAPRVLPKGTATGGTNAVRINDSGNIVGYGSFPDATQSWDAVMWKRDGELVRLGMWPSGPTNSAVATVGDINNRNVIVGTVTGKRAARPAIWPTPQAVHWLGSANGDLVSGEAYAANDSGVVVGRLWVAGGGFRAVRWTANGSMQELGDLPGGNENSNAVGVNASGQIIGSGNSDRGMRAVLWNSDGSMLDLGELPDGENLGYTGIGINDLGEAVGSAYNFETGMTQAFLWTAGTGMVRVADLVDPLDPLHGLLESGATIYVYDINDAGVMVGILETTGPRSTSQVPIVLMPQP